MYLKKGSKFLEDEPDVCEVTHYSEDLLRKLKTRDDPGNKKQNEESFVNNGIGPTKK